MNGTNPGDCSDLIVSRIAGLRKTGKEKLILSSHYRPFDDREISNEEGDMAELTGRVLKPGDPGWDGARHGFAQWADYDKNMPRAVVFCQDTQDVVNAVAWAKENKVPVRARSGRHNYEGWSSLVKDGLVIDLSDIDYVRISSDRSTATVGAGIDALEALEAFSDVGVTMPIATGKTVGLAGLTLGGGFGVTSRKWGLTCDNLVSLEIVTADGSVRTASATENSDLFWACRGGGGGNFGIVTSFTYTVHPVGNVAVFSVDYGWDNFEQVVDRWQKWNEAAEDSLTTYITLLTTRSITFQGQMTPDSEQDLGRVNALLAPMLDPTLLPTAVSIRILPNQIANRIVVGVDPMIPEWRVHKHSDEQIFKSSSALAYELFPPEALSTLKKELEIVPPLSADPSQPSMIQLLGGGGAVARPSTDATAAYHRKAKFVVQYDAYWTARQDSAATISWIEHFRSLLAPYTRGAYVNYVDHFIKDPLVEYFADNLPRLKEIKKKYDPDNFFHWPQSIPPA
jgi:FAD/FMN-containing dehydrogenase